MALIPSKRIRELVSKKNLNPKEEKELEQLCKSETRAIERNPSDFPLFGFWGIKSLF